MTVVFEACEDAPPSEYFIKPLVTGATSGHCPKLVAVKINN